MEKTGTHDGLYGTEFKIIVQIVLFLNTPSYLVSDYFGNC